MSATSIAPTPEAVIVAETGRGKFQVEARAGSSAIVIDEPVSSGGLGSGPNPYDLLCAALGACTAMTIRLYATQKQWSVARISVRVVHHRKTLTARDAFDREIMLDGDLSDEQRTRLLQIAERCPVHLTLDHGADIRTTLAPVQSKPADPVASNQHMDHVKEACGA